MVQRERRADQLYHGLVPDSGEAKVMTDIVERLRSPEVLITNGLLISPVAYEGAAEIARLRAENGRLQKSVDVKREVRDCMLKSMLAKIDEVKKLTTENERLRAVLEPFATFCAEMDALPHCAAKPDEAVIHWPLTVGAFRAARSAWEGK
jgi:hypothetical protein